MDLIPGGGPEISQPVRGSQKKKKEKKKIRPGFCFLFICRHKFKTIVRNLRNFVVLFCCNEDILGLRDSLHLILTLYH